MNMGRVKGFTIIEVTLFLAITGAIAIVMVVGFSSQIAAQRYYDSVNEFKSKLDNIYNGVNNIQNFFDNNMVTCDSYANIQLKEDRSAPDRGMSDCVILGSYVWMDGSNPDTFRKRIVVGYKSPSDRRQEYLTSIETDEQDLKSYRLNIISGSYMKSVGGTVQSVTTADESKLSWGSYPNNTPFSILVLRAGNSGNIRTYVSNNIVNFDGTTVDAELKDMIKPENQKELNFCIMPSGYSGYRGAKTALRLNAHASGSGAVQYLNTEQSNNVGCR